MSEDDLKCAGLLLEFFDAARIGDGNLAAGANTLAAMALTLSNVQRPGAGVFWDQDGSRIAVGSGFVMAGSLGASLVEEHVIGPLMVCQDSLHGNVRHYGEVIQREREVATLKGRPLDGIEEVKHTDEPVLRELMRPSMLQRDELGKAMRLLERPPRGNIREIQNHPLVFGNADSPAAFERLLEPAHLGSPLLHVALHEPGDSQSFAKACNRLMDGCHLPQTAARTVRGRIMVTDSGNLLEGALRGGGAGAAWLSRIPWLLDNAPGPDFKRILDPAASGRLSKVVIRFRSALRQAWAERLSDACEKEAQLEFDFGADQRAWVRFLTGYEASFPGITGMLRPLYASILYGLWRLAKLDRAGALSFNGKIFAIPCFCQMLALRMVNARQAMLHDSRRARLEAVAESVRIKLTGGPLTVREIIRKSHRLQASNCENAIDLLLSRGLVKFSANRWELIQDAIAVAPAQPLTLDV